LSLLVRLDLVAYLLQPAMQALVGVAFVVSIVFAILGVASFFGDRDWWVIVAIFVLGFGGIFMGCIARGAGRGMRGVLAGLVIVPVVAAYSWMIWPVLARAAFRQLRGRTGWAKTAREPVGSRG